MRLGNSVSGLLSIGLVLTVGLGCRSIMSKADIQSTSNASNSVGTSNTAAVNKASAVENTKNTEKKTADNAGLEKPDFTVTSEALDKEFTGPNASEANLKKYANKYIAVTGRVTMLVTEKKDDVQPWVTLYAPGTLGGVNCYFDDDKVGQMKLLKEDAVAKVQGFQDDLIVPKVSPMLKHCAVLEHP